MIMKTTTKLTMIAALGAAFLATTGAFAQFTVGEDTVGVQGIYSNDNGVTAKGFSADVGVNVFDFDFGGIDLVVNGGWATLGDFGDLYVLTGGVRAYNTIGDFRPFVGVSYTQNRWKGFGTTEHSNFIPVYGGVEWDVGFLDQLTVGAVVTYSDAKTSDGLWSYGAFASWWVTSNWAVQGGVTYTNETSTTVYGAGIRFTF